MNDHDPHPADLPQWERVPRDEAKRLRELTHSCQTQHHGDGPLRRGDWATSADRGPRLKWPIILFLATCVTTFDARGLIYAAGILTILLCHEFGHYLQARRYHVAASLPYFIPMPFSPLGTMGAIIGMSGRIPHRKALFDIGISGPLAGLGPALVCSVLGLYWSRVAPVLPNTGYIEFGDPLVFQWLARWIHGELPQGMHIWLHPLGLAGWGGIFVTALNLIPIGQLDGGHILYAMLRQKSYPITTLLLYGALGWMIFSGNYGWILLVLLLLISGPMHPPTHDDTIPLGTGRTVLGWLTLAFIVVGFTPVPIKFYGL